MSFDQLAIIAHRRIYQTMGEDVAVTDLVANTTDPVRAIVDRNVNFVDTRTQAYGIRHEIEFMRETIVPAKGWTVAAGTETFQLDAPIDVSAVKYVTRWYAKKLP